MVQARQPPKSISRLYSPSTPSTHSNRPSYKAPLEYSYNSEEVDTAYVNVIQNICPTGPILVHSWSIGGIFAVEASG